MMRGKARKLIGWFLDEEEEERDSYGAEVVLDKLPSMLFLKFENAKWKLDGLPRGVYPIKPVKRRWALDKGRPNPKLHIDRWQFPLAPAFAITAHASQGQTLDSAIVDVSIVSESSPVAKRMC